MVETVGGGILSLFNISENLMVDTDDNDRSKTTQTSIAEASSCFHLSFRRTAAMADQQQPTSGPAQWPPVEVQGPKPAGEPAQWPPPNTNAVQTSPSMGELYTDQYGDVWPKHAKKTSM